MRDRVDKALDLLPPEQHDKAGLEAIANVYKESLYALAKSGLGFKDLAPKTHKPITQLLQNEGKRKLVCVPRGCLKSSIACVAYPIWLLINNPDLRILIDSELWTNSATFIREIKLHLESPELTSLFGDFKGSTWNSDELIIKQRRKKLKEASVTAGGVGTTKVGQHYDVIIHDDMNSPDNTNTVENATKVINHFKYNVSILENQGTMVVIGTRYSEVDVIGHILQNEDVEMF